MHPVIRAVITGGGIAGTLDIAYALVFHGLRGAQPTRILQSIASGLLGRDAYSGGLATAAVGLGAHYFIAFCMAAVFCVAARRMPALRGHAFVAGSLYGFCAFWVMNLIVLPLSAVPFAVTFAPWPTTLGLLVHIGFVGIPIAYAAKLMPAIQQAEPGATDNPGDAR